MVQESRQVDKVRNKYVTRYCMIAFCLVRVLRNKYNLFYVFSRQIRQSATTDRSQGESLLLDPIVLSQIALRREQHMANKV